MHTHEINVPGIGEVIVNTNSDWSGDAIIDIPEHCRRDWAQPDGPTIPVKGERIMIPGQVLLAIGRVFAGHDLNLAIQKCIDDNLYPKEAE